MIEKPIPGFGELFRMLSFQKIGSSTVQSRAAAGVAKGTYLFALPGSPGACRDGWDEILQRSSTSVTDRATSPNCCPACASTRPPLRNLSRCWTTIRSSHGGPPRRAHAVNH